MFWWWQTISLDTLRHMLPGPKPPRPPLKPYGTNSSSMLGYQKRSCQIRSELESQLVADLCMVMGTQKIWTSLYHPQTNGQCERLNSTLIGMLGTLPPEKKSEWKNHIGTLVHTYNCTQNSATGLSPYYLMYGRQPHLPVDVTVGLALQSVSASNTSKFVQKMWKHVKWSHKKAEAFQAKEAQCHKQNYDKRSRAVALEVRDMVLVWVTTSRAITKYRIHGKIVNL